MDAADIKNRFQYHAPKFVAAVEAHGSVRERCAELASALNARLPEGREKSLAVTKIEEAMFWANAAIARNQ